MYAREIQGNVHSFGVSGTLIKNALVMYDRETDTLWSQFLSQGVAGPLAGVRLEFVPSLLTDWQSWVEMHPETWVLAKQGQYQSDSYESYYRGGNAGILGESTTDTRLDRKELVLGLEVDGVKKAYALGRLQDAPLVHDTLGETPVVIMFDSNSGVAVAYENTVDGQPATFALEGSSDGAMVFLVDQAGGRWNAFSGEPVSSDTGARPLRRLPSFYSFWFAWKGFHPETQVFEG